MGLEEIWFVLIGVLWSGYFLLEGFDFGVGMLLPVLPRDERERGMMFESIGPVWDGNEVWLVVAAGATFAAFPAWYATLFSGFYLALLLILVLLIVRVVSFEWRESRTAHAGGRAGCGRTRSGASAPPSSGESRSRTSSHGVPLELLARVHRRDPRPVQRLHRARRARSRCAVRPARRHVSDVRTTGDFRERAVARPPGDWRLPAVILGGGVAAWTVLVAPTTTTAGQSCRRPSPRC